ncbi:MAG: hypothetical protein O9308_07540 [Beijerinckiaceae bacterium]|nr:hypothetical protein [Beijerinckiaceae bacterium]
MQHKQDLSNRFYEILWTAEQNFGLWDYEKFENQADELPAAGVYFFFEPGELRANHDNWHRVVRVGTHQVSQGSKSSFKDRLRNHFGASESAIGRGSVFRDHVGASLFGRNGWEVHTDEVSHQRHSIVSTYIRSMSFVLVPVDDEAGRESERRTIELGSIALLSNYRLSQAEQIDPPSENWLRLRCESRAEPEDHVRRSGLWNVDGVDREYSPEFLNILEKRASR